MRLVALLICVLGCSSAVAHAQTPIVNAGQPYRVSATHDGANTVGYRFIVDNVQVGDVPVSQLQTQTITFTAPPVTRGAHSVVVTAYNEDGEARSAPLAFTAVRPLPGPPSNLVITIVVTVASDGTVTATVARVQR